ncbi:MAG: hypothetical protein A2W80_11120 [Candidatus Riflebacteria bacterium GWC2_50_8]|nr:MAG: hypothetical protein A2W80_11120 [Candidatus Riflebacteria bacterium GWC2_50_8]
MNIIKSLRRKGFSLAEIIVSTIVMTMLMVSVIGYIQYSGIIWQDGYSKISGANYMRMITELIRQDLMRAASITEPAALIGGNATPTSMLRYSITGITGATFTIAVDTTETCLKRYSAPIISTMTTRIARNVASFTATRLSTWTVQIHIELQNDDPEEDGTYRIIASETLSFMAPGAG